MNHTAIGLGIGLRLGLGLGLWLGVGVVMNGKIINTVLLIPTGALYKACIFST